MTKVLLTSQVEIDFDEVLKGVAQLETRDLERFVRKVIALQAHRRAHSLPQREAKLLAKINRGLPAEIRQRFAELNDKLREETINPEEHQELLQLIDQVELADAERIKNLAELARLRKVSLTDLMNQLGLGRPIYA